MVDLGFAIGGGHQPIGGHRHPMQELFGENVCESERIGRVLGTPVRCNLAVHRSVTPFIIWQPIQRPRLLERVYQSMRTSH